MCSSDLAQSPSAQQSLVGNECSFISRFLGVGSLLLLLLSLARLLAQLLVLADETNKVDDQQLGLLECGEVTASREVRELDEIGETLLDDQLWLVEELVGEHSTGGGYLDGNPERSIKLRIILFSVENVQKGG